MPSLIQKPSGIWYFVYHANGKQRWKSLKTKDKNAAKRIYNQLNVKLDNAKSGLAPKKCKLADAIDSYLGKKRSVLKQNTIDQYQRQCDTVKRVLTVEFIHQINSVTIDDFVTKRKADGLSGKSIKEELATIKSVIKHALNHNLIGELPRVEWPVLKTIPVAPDTLDFYTLQEIELLKKRMAGRSFEPIFLYGLYTGCRLREIIQIQAKDVNLEEGFIRVRNSKTESDAKNQFRRVPIHQTLSEFLQKHMENLKLTDYLFPLLHSNQLSFASKTLKRHCKACGVPYKRFHGLRHTTATYLLASGVDLATVMAIMGWTRLETAKRYIHMAGVAKTAMAKLPY